MTHFKIPFMEKKTLLNKKKMVLPYLYPNLITWKSQAAWKLHNGQQSIASKQEENLQTVKILAWFHRTTLCGLQQASLWNGLRESRAHWNFCCNNQSFLPDICNNCFLKTPFQDICVRGILRKVGRHLTATVSITLQRANRHEQMVKDALLCCKKRELKRTWRFCIDQCA